MISQLSLVACCHASHSIRGSSSGTVSKNKPVSRSRSWPWCLLQQQKAPNTFWSLWKFTSSFGKLEVQDNVFRGGCNSSVVRHISQILPPPASQRLHCSKGSLPQYRSVGFLQRLQHCYTLPGHSDSWNQRIHHPSPWDSRFQSWHPIHSTDKFCCQLIMHPGHLVPPYQCPMFVLLLGAEEFSGLLISQGGSVADQSLVWKATLPLFQGRAICLSFMVLTFLTITAALWVYALTGTLSFLHLFFSLNCIFCVASSTLALFIVNLYKCYQLILHRFSVMPNKLVFYFKIQPHINDQGTGRKQLHALPKYMNGPYHFYRDLVLLWKILAWVSTICIILSTTVFPDPARIVL